MAKIKVQAYNPENIYGGLANRNVCFSLVSSPKDGRRQVMNFMGCKAYIHDAVQSHVLGTRDCGCHYSKGNNPPIDMNKLRLLVATNSNDIEDYKKRLFAAKKMLNLFEEAAGWKPSKITTVEHTVLKKGVWLITGPKQWMHSPQMLSMVTLLIRIAVRNGPVNPKDEKEVTDIFKKWISAEVNYRDSEYLRVSWDKMFLIVKNYKELFENLTVEQCYDSGVIGSHSNGIANWCSGRAGFDELNKRLEELCNKHGLELSKGYY